MAAQTQTPERITLYLREPLASDFRKHCYDERLSLSEFASAALTTQLKKAKIAADLKSKKVQR